MTSSYDEQLTSWANGEPTHVGDRLDGQCCPDFSCCRPELLQPKEVREAFVAADEDQRTRFLGQFLGLALADDPAKIYVAGVPDTRRRSE